MKKAKWIWYNGDFEIYHSLLLHSRREQYGYDFPSMWSIPTPHPTVSFRTSYHSDSEDTVRLVTHHKAFLEIDGKLRFAANTDAVIPAGDHRVRIDVIATAGLPAIYINSKYLVTDESWTVDDLAPPVVSAGCWDAFDKPEQNPEVFPFEYERIEPVKVIKTESGRVFDFGRESFGIIHIEGADPAFPVRVTYGESMEEVCDYDEAIVRETVSGSADYALIPRAFRFIRVETEGACKPEVYADYEYLPLEHRGSFACNRASVNRIWQVCAHTLHLNSREFFLDGIKRDRWCWAGDAYQSYMANSYLFFDPDITKRTIVALLGKPPYRQHINTINDYSLYLIISVYEYYYATGDKRFVETFYPRVRALYDFVVGRLDGQGYMCRRDRDWIFMDWSPMDKSGPLCAEQILLWQCHRTMALISELVGEDGDKFLKAADRLKRNIMRDYWREDRGAFVDCFTSGKENVTRHAHIFALMYDFVSAKRARRIMRSVLENDEVTAITTPYFEFFELCALCKMGRLKHMQKKIESYWGGMVKLGATSIWEEYIPEQEGAEHYSSYGMRYGRSLCHAWGGGPIYLLGRYCLGVYPTSVGYATYAVEPRLGVYRSIDGRVPLPDGGEVWVRADAKTCTVVSNRKGGTLIFGGREYKLPVGEFCVEI
jgi:hypothetical protein